MATDEEQYYQDELNALRTQPPIVLPTRARSSPDDGTSPGLLGRIGEALGGGQAPGYRLRGREEDAAGSRALLNFGINMLLASGPSRVKPDLLSAAATGLQGAQQSIGEDQQRAAAGAAADYRERLDQAKLAITDRHGRIEQLKAALPLLQMQRTQSSPLPWETSAAAAPAAAGTAAAPVDKATFLQQTAKRESGGNPTVLNYVAQQDPTAYDRGATASGKYQIVNSTWREGMQLAGLDPSKYAEARQAPEAVQDQVASAIYDKYGTRPWQKGAQDWVKDERGQYQLATVRPPAGSPGGAPQTAAAPPPPSPTVAAIQTGMDQARAAPGVQVAQAGPPTATSGGAPPPGADEGFDAWRASRPIRFTPEQEATFKIAPDQGTLATLAQQEKAAMQAAAIARRNGDQAGIDKATAAWQAIQTAKAKALDDATEKGRAARAAATEAEIGRQHTDFVAARTQRGEIEKEARAQQRAIELKTMEIKAQADETRRTNADSSRLEIAKKQMDAINTESLAAKDRIDDLDGLQILSENAGGATNLASTAVGGKSMLDRMVAIGAGTKEQLAQYGQMQQFQAGLAAVIKSLRQGMSLGSASDADLRYIESMGPSLMQDKQTRSEVISYIRDMQYRKMQFGAEVDRLMTDQPGMTIGRAIREAREGMPDVIPKVPQEVFGMPLADKQQWFRDHVRPKQLIRLPDGRVAVSPFGG